LKGVPQFRHVLPRPLVVDTAGAFDRRAIVPGQDWGGERKGRSTMQARRQSSRSRTASCAASFPAPPWCVSRCNHPLAIDAPSLARAAAGCKSSLAAAHAASAAHDWLTAPPNVASHASLAAFLAARSTRLG